MHPSEAKAWVHSPHEPERREQFLGAAGHESFSTTHSLSGHSSTWQGSLSLGSMGRQVSPSTHHPQAGSAAQDPQFWWSSQWAMAAAQVSPPWGLCGQRHLPGTRSRAEAQTSSPWQKRQSSLGSAMHSAQPVK